MVTIRPLDIWFVDSSTFVQGTDCVLSQEEWAYYDVWDLMSVPARRVIE